MTTLTWIPQSSDLDADLERAREYYGRSARKLVTVLDPSHRRRCTATLERLDAAGYGTHPYLVEWFNRQRANFELPDRQPIFEAFADLEDLERRIAESEARRQRALAVHGFPFDIHTRSADIPYAMTHIRREASEAYGSMFPEVNVLEQPSEQLVDMVRQAWAALERYWPDAAAEISRTTRTISFFENDFLIGGALQSYLGGIFLTQRRATNAIELAEEILHECSHTRLFYAMIDRELWTNPPQQRYETVLRPDRRPFWGLFHQLFVLTRLDEYYRRVAEESADQLETRQEVHAQAVRAAATVAEIGELTEKGAALFASISAHLHATSN